MLRIYSSQHDIDLRAGEVLNRVGLYTNKPACSEKKMCFKPATNHLLTVRGHTYNMKGITGYY